MWCVRPEWFIPGPMYQHALRRSSGDIGTAMDDVTGERWKEASSVPPFGSGPEADGRIDRCLWFRHARLYPRPSRRRRPSMRGRTSEERCGHKRARWGTGVLYVCSCSHRNTIVTQCRSVALARRANTRDDRALPAEQRSIVVPHGDALFGTNHW